MSRSAEHTVALEEISAALSRARATSAPIPPPSEAHPWLTVADAYRVQQHGTAARLRDGERIVGHKVGLTAAAMQAQLGVDEPDFGVLWAGDEIGDGEEVSLAELIAPRVEPEIAFVLGAPLRGPGVTIDAVLEATDHVRPALEIIDSRVADWRITLVDTVADNASGAGLVLGPPSDIVADRRLADVGVTLSVDGELVATGLGSAVLGHPASAVVWLADTLGELGVGLEAGQVVLPGSMTGAQPLLPGAHVVADFGSLGVVSCRGSVAR